jgi:hypothetical protein
MKLVEMPILSQQAWEVHVLVLEKVQKACHVDACTSLLSRQHVIGVVHLSCPRRTVSRVVWPPLKICKDVLLDRE